MPRPSRNVGAVSLLTGAAFLVKINCEHDPLQLLPTEITSNPPSIYVRRPLSIQHPSTHAITFGIYLPILHGLQLWNILWLHVTRTTPLARSDLVSEWLSRAGELPLYISMFQPHYVHFQDLEEDSDTFRAITSMVDTLTQYAHRWKVLPLPSRSAPFVLSTTSPMHPGKLQCELRCHR